MIDTFIYAMLPIILVVDLAILGIVIAVVSRQGCCNGDKDKKKCKQVVDVFLTRGSQGMNLAGAAGFNSNPVGGTQPNTGLNVTNTMLDNDIGAIRTHGIPGVHDFQTYNDCRFPENISGDNFLPLGAEITTSPPCNPNALAALDWIYIATTANLSHVKMRLTISASCFNAAGASITIKGCLPKVLSVHWYNFYGYKYNVRHFKHCGKGVYEFEVPVVVSNPFFPVTEITFHYCPTQSLTPGATYRYKVEVLGARCVTLINRKCDATYYAIQDVPGASPLTIQQAGGKGFECSSCSGNKSQCTCKKSSCNSCGNKKSKCGC